MSTERIDPMQFGDVSDWVRSFDPPMRLVDVIGVKIGLSGTLAVAAVLWPEFVEVRGCVLLSWRYNATEFEGWWSQLAGDRTAIEDMVNHLHLWDVFPDVEDPLTERGLVELGQLMAESWRYALRSAYPDRDFLVSFDMEEEEYGPTVSFRSL
ncbi:MAG: hypothetical protein GY835_02860 [bacterium]|nr:hypothetical protein [bacterium]